MKPAGFWIRAGAYTLDCLLTFSVASSIQMTIILLKGPQVLVGVVGFLVPAFYFSVMTALLGRTLGKMAGGMAVRGPENAPVDAGRAIGRYFAYFLSALPAGLGFFAAAFTKDKRALHDYLAGTRVVYVMEIPTWRKVLVSCAAFIPLLAGVVIAVLSS